MDQHPKPETVLDRGNALKEFFGPARGKRFEDCHNHKSFKTVNYTSHKNQKWWIYLNNSKLKRW